MLWERVKVQFRVEDIDRGSVRFSVRFIFY